MEEKNPTTQSELPKGKPVGKISHYFSKIGVAVVDLDSGLKVGDDVVIAGRGQEFIQHVDSMQVEHEQVSQAKTGDSVGMKVDQAVKEGDLVYLKG